MATSELGMAMTRAKARKRDSLASMPIGGALKCIAEICGEYSAIHPDQYEHMDRCYRRIVARVFYEDREGKEIMRRPRTAGKRVKAPQHDSMSLSEAMAAVTRAVDHWIRGEGWEEELSAEEKDEAQLAWDRVVLRCNYEDPESKKRLAEHDERRAGPAKEGG